MMVKKYVIDEGELATLVPNPLRREELVSRLTEVRSDGTKTDYWAEDRRPRRQWREVLPPPDERWIDMDAETPEGWVGLAAYQHDGLGGGTRLIRKEGAK